jgi:hypothetical protein
MRYRNRCGRLSVHCRTRTGGNTWSTSCAARSAIRRPPQLGQNPRPLHENGTSRFRPQSSHRNRANLAPARRTPGTRGTPAPRTAAGHIRRAPAPPPRKTSPGDSERFDREPRARPAATRSGRLDAPRDRTVARRVPNEGPSEIRIERPIVRERWQLLRSARLEPLADSAQARPRRCRGYQERESEGGKTQAIVPGRAEVMGCRAANGTWRRSCGASPVLRLCTVVHILN